MSRTAKVLGIVLALLITQLDYGRSSEKVRFYHGTDYDTALTILNDRNLTPFTVQSYMTQGGPGENPLEYYRFFTDFGKGLYTVREENKDYAIEAAKLITKKKKKEKWGVVVFYVSKEDLDQAENPLIFQDKRSRPSNAPVLDNSSGQPADWLQFIEHNRHIRDVSILKKDDYTWEKYDWIEGPIWVPRDSNIDEGRDPFPDSLLQINWVRGLKILNKADRELISGESGHPCPNVAGAWEGELVVKEVNGSTNIQVGQSRFVRGNSFVITQDDCTAVLKFNNNEITGYFKPGETIPSQIGGRTERMEIDTVVLTENPTGPLTRAELTIYGLGAGSLKGKLKVEIEQRSPNGAVIVSGGMLERK
jgi:hypothetical protein